MKKIAGITLKFLREKTEKDRNWMIERRISRALSVDHGRVCGCGLRQTWGNRAFKVSWEYEHTEVETWVKALLGPVIIFLMFIKKREYVVVFFIPLRNKIITCNNRERKLKINILGIKYLHGNLREI